MDENKEEKASTQDAGLIEDSKIASPASQDDTSPQPKPLPKVETRDRHHARDEQDISNTAEQTPPHKRDASMDALDDGARWDRSRRGGRSEHRGDRGSRQGSEREARDSREARSSEGRGRRGTDRSDRGADRGDRGERRSHADRGDRGADRSKRPSRPQRGASKDAGAKTDRPPRRKNTTPHTRIAHHNLDNYENDSIGGVRTILDLDEKSNVNFRKDLKKGVLANNEIQKDALTASIANSREKVRITPLGGLGEIGGNMTIIETDKSAIIIDVGMSFPDDSMHGVDILVPDFTYLKSIKDKVAGVIITHAHEDHIGAVPYLFKEYQFPIYGTPLPLGMIGNKFDEHGLKQFRSLFRIVEKRKEIEIGEFVIEWIHITHSVIDASALAIQTRAGLLLHTGDFKIDHTPIDNMPTDLHRIAYYGEMGVLLMLSDSTNSHKSGITPSEAIVGPTFDNIFKSTDTRIIMSTFSSNIHRVYQAIKYGIKYGRKVAVIGRSMEKNLEMARELGYIDIPNSAFIDASDVAKYPDDEVLIVTTGSQGEEMSALYRMAIDEHRHIKIKPNDVIILSSKAIPGNEEKISNVTNHLIRAGARLITAEHGELHVSGHASQEEQKLLLRLVKPKFFLPVHGEFNHIAKHKETAIKCGVNPRNIYLMEDGDQMEVSSNYLRKVKSVKTGKVYINNQTNTKVEGVVVNERQALAESGMLSAIITLKGSKLDGILLDQMGITGNLKGIEKELRHEIEMMVKTALEKRLDTKKLGADLKHMLRKAMFKRFKNYPSILVYILNK